MNKVLLTIIALAIWQAALILMAIILIPMVANWWGDYLGWPSAFLVSGGLACFSAALIAWWLTLSHIRKEKKE